MLRDERNELYGGKACQFSLRWGLFVLMLSCILYGVLWALDINGTVMLTLCVYTWGVVVFLWLIAQLRYKWLKRQG